MLVEDPDVCRVPRGLGVADAVVETERSVGAAGLDLGSVGLGDGHLVIREVIYGRPGDVLRRLARQDRPRRVRSRSPPPGGDRRSWASTRSSEQWIQRSHGTEFDRLVRIAREQLHGGEDGVREHTRIGHAKDTSPRANAQPLIGRGAETRRTPRFAGLLGSGKDPNSNRGHQRFQSCALPTESSRRRAGVCAG